VGRSDDLAADQRQRPVRHVNSLDRRFLPGLGRTVAGIGAGCWAIGGLSVNGGAPIGWDDVDPEAAYAGLVRAHELGVELFDTADAYGLGRSERLLGRLVARVGRSSLVLSSKVGHIAGAGCHPYSRAQLLRQLDRTLDNLGTDHLDLYHLHSTDFGHLDQHLPAVIEVLTELRSDGTIRAVGMRAPHDVDETRRFIHLFEAIRPDVITVRYNLLTPTHDIFDFAARHGTGVVIKQALGQGLLVHPRPDTREFSSGDHRSRDPLFTPTARTELWQHLAPLRARFGTEARDLLRVALRYALQTQPQSPVLVGFRNAEQIEASVTGLGEPLSAEDIDYIHEHLHPGRTSQP
jgi:1-deoxyxylulose-5-phosphate synthase